ncbi:MAG: hypothetical protein Q9168_001362 [Polycauliona sp. 1 TL-2023]
MNSAAGKPSRTLRLYIAGTCNLLRPDFPSTAAQDMMLYPIPPGGPLKQGHAFNDVDDRGRPQLPPFISWRSGQVFMRVVRKSIKSGEHAAEEKREESSPPVQTFKSGVNTHQLRTPVIVGIGRPST